MQFERVSSKFKVVYTQKNNVWWILIICSSHLPAVKKFKSKILTGIMNNIIAFNKKQFF